MKAWQRQNLHRLSIVSCLTILVSFGVIVFGFINETNSMKTVLKPFVAGDTAPIMAICLALRAVKDLFPPRCEAWMRGKKARPVTGCPTGLFDPIKECC